MTLPDNQITYQTVPCGGIITLNFLSYDSTGIWSITRSGNGQTILLYEGPATGFTNPKDGQYMWSYLDIGDGTNLPLNPAQVYTYTFSSTNAAPATVSITPACVISIEQDGYLSILMRTITAGVNNIRLPNSPDGQFNRRPDVIIAMPLTGAPKLPIISVAPVLLQQKETPIGHGINSDYRNNRYEIYEQVHRRYTVSIMALSPQERDFYAVAVVTLFKAAMIPILNTMGQDVRNDFQIHYTQIVDPMPGFYVAEVALDFQGSMVAAVLTDYGKVLDIDPEPILEPPARGVG